MDSNENNPAVAGQDQEEGAAAEAQATEGAAKKGKSAVRSEEYPDCVIMTRKGDDDAVVNENSVDLMVKQGWALKRR